HGDQRAGHLGARGPDEGPPARRTADCRPLARRGYGVTRGGGLRAGAALGPSTAAGLVTDRLTSVHLRSDRAGGADRLQHDLGEERAALGAEQRAGVAKGRGAATAAGDEIDDGHLVARLGL